MNMELVDRLYENNVSIEGIWPFPFGHPSEEMMRAFEYHDELPAPLAELTINWREEEVEELYDLGRDAWDELGAAGFRKGLTGYICKAWIPVYQEGGAFSWGHIQSKIFFGQSVGEVLDAACAWARTRYEGAVA